MNQKEINELRRRFRADKSNISRIYGCFVNTNKEIVAYIDSSLGMLKEEEQEIYLGRLKKCLSGGQGRNLMDIAFSTAQVVDSEEHRLLSKLRSTQCADADAREALYRRVIDALDMEQSNYVILLASDSYDVPYRGTDDVEQADASADVFTYFVCAVCPVKDATADLRFYYDVSEFHIASSGPLLGNTALGFLFPAFDDRSANIYNALYYIQKPELLHQEFIDAVFRTEAPMSAPEQRNAFHTALADALDAECSYGVVQSVHEQLRERVELHKAEKNPELLSLEPREVENILRQGGVSEPRVEAFRKAVEESFGEDAALQPGNLVDKKFEIVTPNVKITMPPEYSEMVETRVIDGRKYLLIPAGDGLEVNGISIQF
ncbi:MAG: DUF4317 domain-containing protein [Oscillospiraceae bacterium]|nr:DUF4317 domain-containing protein [Oscillospiraceae bacterium]